jgi:hypothetical protein
VQKQVEEELKREVRVCVCLLFCELTYLVDQIMSKREAEERGMHFMRAAHKLMNTHTHTHNTTHFLRGCACVCGGSGSYKSTTKRIA